MKQFNNNFKLLNNIKEIKQNEKGAWMDTKMDKKIERGCMLHNFEKVRPDVFQVYGKSPGERSFLVQNHLVCDVTIIQYQ